MGGILKSFTPVSDVLVINLVEIAYTETVLCTLEFLSVCGRGRGKRGRGQEKLRGKKGFGVNVNINCILKNGCLLYLEGVALGRNAVSKPVH